jgi:hypothetical protein
MNRNQPTTQDEPRDARRDAPTGAVAPPEGDDLASAPDHDVPNEEVIEKTLPEPNPDKQR